MGRELSRADAERKESQPAGIRIRVRLAWSAHPQYTRFGHPRFQVHGHGESMHKRRHAQNREPDRNTNLLAPIPFSHCGVHLHKIGAASTEGHAERAALRTDRLTLTLKTAGAEVPSHNCFGTLRLNNPFCRKIRLGCGLHHESAMRHERSDARSLGNMDQARERFTA